MNHIVDCSLQSNDILSLHKCLLEIILMGENVVGPEESCNEIILLHKETVNTFVLIFQYLL